jgi:hypothetical protein
MTCIVYALILHFPWFSQSLTFYRYFDLELASTREPVHREWHLRRIRESKQEYLALMEQEYARIDRENAQLEEASRKIEANKKK